MLSWLDTGFVLGLVLGGLGGERLRLPPRLTALRPCASWTACRGDSEITVASLRRDRSQLSSASHPCRLPNLHRGAKQSSEAANVAGPLLRPRTQRESKPTARAAKPHKSKSKTVEQKEEVRCMLNYYGDLRSTQMAKLKDAPKPLHKERAYATTLTAVTHALYSALSGQHLACWPSAHHQSSACKP